MTLILRLLDLYVILIIARVFISWLNINSYNSIISFIYKTTEPLLGPIRRFLQSKVRSTMIDFSPMIAIFIVQIIKDLLVRIMFRYM